MEGGQAAETRHRFSLCLVEPSLQSEGSFKAEVVRLKLVGDQVASYGRRGRGGGAGI